MDEIYQPRDITEKENNRGWLEQLDAGTGSWEEGLAAVMAFSQELISPGFAHPLYLPSGSFLHLPLPLVVFGYECETKLLPKESICSVFHGLLGIFLLLNDHSGFLGSMR